MTVLLVMNSSSAMSRFERPRASRLRISRSRAVSAPRPSSWRSSLSAPGRAAQGVEHGRRDGGREDHLAARHRRDAALELLGLEAPVHEVAGRAVADRAGDQVLVLAVGQHQHLGLLAQRPGGGDAVHHRHPHVQADDVGLGPRPRGRSPRARRRPRRRPRSPGSRPAGWRCRGARWRCRRRGGLGSLPREAGHRSRKASLVARRRRGGAGAGAAGSGRPAPAPAAAPRAQASIATQAETRSPPRAPTRR